MCRWCQESSNDQAHVNDPPVAPQWGLKTEMCAYQLGQLEATVTKRQATVRADYLKDYARIRSVIKDVPLIQQCLNSLGGEISAKTSGSSPDANWLRFSAILAHYEKKCGFPEDVLLPMGVLDAKDFYHYIRLGYVLKDYGAGVRHGEFTHRVQWHILMRVITENFTKPFRQGWDHSPLQLYVSLGFAEHTNIWALLLDLMGEGDFNHPDSFHAWLLQNAPQNIVQFLSKRETKRRAQFVADIMGFLEYLATVGEIDKSRVEFFRSLDPPQSHDAFKEFELHFLRQLRAIRENENDVKTMYYKNTSWKSRKAYIENKTAALPGDVKAKHRKVPYVSIGQGPVYVLSGKHIMDVSMADQRANQSRATLF